MKRFTRDDSLWVRLQKETRPIFLYGTGNGADKILDVCRRFNIPVEGVFASSDFVRNRTFRDMPVQSIEMIREKYGDDFVVLLAFGTTLSSVVENIKAVAERHTLFIPEVPLYGTELFTYEYYTEHLSEIESACELFADEESRKVYEDMIGFRLSGEPKLLANAESMALSYEDILGGESYSCAIDCGAYKGDSTEMMARVLSPERIIAVEPDPKTYLKLSAYAENETLTEVKAVNAAVGKETGTVEFMSSASRGSGKEGISKSAKCKTVPLLTVDEIAKGEKVDLLKLDVEGDEADAIEGALETIKRCCPAMAVSVYHRTEDIFSLTKKINELLPDHDLYLRREECIPAWDITLFAKRN
ncbi:MAG: FkbM family methyltransferase [Clostridia bacterium]|nr:FkbM family methyltransferase [Clostridia bacterium]